MAQPLHLLTCYSPTGTSLTSLNDFVALECTLAEGQVGGLVITLPAIYDDRLFQRDGQITYHRYPADGGGLGTPKLVGDTTWLITRRRRRLWRDDAGRMQQRITLHCVHPNHLLGRRLVGYKEGTANADKTGIADDVLKAYVRENFLTDVDTTRNWASTAFAVQADTGSSNTSVQMAVSYRNVLQVCQEIVAQASQTQYLNFEVSKPGGAGPFTLRTYTGQRGTNRGAASGQGLLIAVDTGAMTEIEADEDWTNIATFIYVGGQGTGDDRAIGTDSDAVLIAASPYGRIEVFTNQSQSEATMLLEGAAARRLWELRPRRLFTGAVQSTDTATFGQEYDWGDIVVGRLRAFDESINQVIDYQFDARVDPVRISVSRELDDAGLIIGETEQLDIRLRGEAS